MNIINNMWQGECPICGKSLGSRPFSEVQNKVGVTIECPHCNSLIRMNNDFNYEDYDDYVYELYKAQQEMYSEVEY